MGNIKAVIFDMDGVITETSEMHYEAWKKTADQLGIEIDRVFNETLKGISRKASLLRILAHGGKEDLYSEQEIKQLMHDKNEFYLTLIASFDQSHLNPGIWQLMNDLHHANIKIAVASASKSAPLLIEKMGLGHLVDYIVDPRTVPGKPAPDLFLKAAEALSVKPETCIGIEDAKSGVQAIKHAGMFAVGIGNPSVLAEADVVLENTSLLTYEFLMQLQ